MLATAPGAKLSATIAAFSAALQRRRRGTPVRTSTRRKLCPSIGKLLGKSASPPCLNEAGSSVRHQVSQDGGSAPLTLDHVSRQFNAPRPNALWVSDFTYVATWVGFIYVAFVIDVFARRIIGWRVSRTAHAGFVLDALEQALHE